MPENINPLFALTGIDQVGVVVNDLEKAIDFYTSTFGIGPFRVWEQYNPDLIVHGKVSPCRTKFAVTRIGPLQIELIQNLEGENIYTEFLREKGEGLHHIAIRVDDVDDEIARWESSGMTALQKGHFEGVSWAYFANPQAGGVIIEILPRPSRKQV